MTEVQMSGFELSDEDIEREVHRIEQGGNAWEDTEEVQLEIKRPLETVVPVRLSSETWEALRLEAGKLGVGPSTLVGIWVMEKLRESAPTRSSG
jgi:hypothetical protein